MKFGDVGAGSEKQIFRKEKNQSSVVIYVLLICIKKAETIWVLKTTYLLWGGFNKGKYTWHFEE